MHNYRTLFAAAAIAASSLAATAVEPVPAAADRAAAARWADSVYNSLTVRQRLAQLVFPKVTPAGAASSKAAIRRYASEGVGGLLFSEGSLAEYVEMTNYAQEQSEVPMLMTFDGEWGLSMRIAELPRFPSNMALGAVQSPRLIYDYGAEMARECRLTGVQCNFAPDADVNSNPANPVIGYRAFGEDPATVARLTVAYTLGMEDAGVQATPKHFPGHGDTSTDSHKTVTMVSHSRAMLDSTDLRPFREAVDAGASAIMVGHLVVPALDPSGAPASLSPAIIGGLLRGDMGFEGLIYTDALGMKGAVDPQGRNPAVAALIAGADVLLCPRAPVDAIAALVQAYGSGAVTDAMIEEHCKRVLRYKYYLGLDVKPHVDTDISALRDSIDTPATRALIKKLAAASVTVLRNSDDILPVGSLANRSIAVVTIGGGDKHNPAGAFASTCRHYADVREFHTGGGLFAESTIRKIKEADVVIVGVFADKAADREVMAQLAAAGIDNMVAAFMVNPYKMKKFAPSLPSAKAIVLAYDDITESAVSAAEAIFGGISVSGKLPVNLRGFAPLGAGIQLSKSRLGFSTPVAEGFSPWLSDSIDTFVKQCLRKGAFPGCQVLVARNGNIVFDRAYGRTGDRLSSEVDSRTIYDLASVSKATGTLPGIMKAYDSGLLSLDATLGELIPEISDTAKHCITVRQLLFHESGMPAALNMYGVMVDSATFTGKLFTARPDRNHSIRVGRRSYGHNSARMRSDIVSRSRTDAFPIEADNGIYTGRSSYDTLMRRIYDIPLRSTRAYNYSCLNFCLLMDIEQRLTGKPHDEYVRDEIFAPLGAYRTGYRPRERFEPSEIAPTENDKFLRRQTVHGYVHDELANFSGGVQGNAGLFANADDIAKICQMLLNGGTYGDVRVLSDETAGLFTTAKSPTCRRGLGFDKPDTENPDYSPTCDEAGAGVFGHLGFTGTCFWVDPDKDVIFVFLTNRVYPIRETPVFNSLNIRPHLFSLVYKALEE